MTSRQYNFYPQINELKKFEIYLQSKGFIILKVPAKKLPFEKTNKIIHSESDFWPKRFISKPDFVEKIVHEFINTQNHYLIDVIQSNVIEFSLPKKIGEPDNAKNGRVYFVTGYYDEKNEWVKKEPLFINEAKNLLQWCQRNFTDKY